MSEALMIGSVRQHELAEVTARLNAELEREIAERKTVERALREQARLLDLSHDGIIVCDLDGRILYWSHGAEELYGWMRDEAVGKVIHSLLQTQFPEPLEHVLGELHRNSRWTGELVQTKRDGLRITVLARQALDSDSQGNPTAVLENITDITEPVRMRQELIEAKDALAHQASHLERLVGERTEELMETNKQLQAFVYTIAHDLRAPLRGMQAFSTLLLEEESAALSATGQEYARGISKSAHFMNTLLTDLLAFASISQQRMKLASVNLQSVVHEALSRLEQEIQEKKAVVEAVGPWPAVMAHEPTLSQVLFNLLSNALKFIAPGVPPRIRVRAEVVEAPELHPPGVPMVRVWVEDNGIGVAPQYQEQIFRVFIRLEGAAYGGTGIGLAIVQKGIERMGGRVGVESALGQGSRFWFELKKAEVKALS